LKLKDRITCWELGGRGVISLKYKRKPCVHKTNCICTAPSTIHPLLVLKWSKSKSYTSSPPSTSKEWHHFTFYLTAPSSGNYKHKDEITICAGANLPTYHFKNHLWDM
jgi:hypothetical protein